MNSVHQLAAQLTCLESVDTNCVKYHENLANPPSRHHARYDEVADRMGCFLPEARERLKRKPLQQVWRDHLLAGIHRLEDGFADGCFAFLYPRDNPACALAVETYRACLSDRDTFAAWTLEELVDAMGATVDAPWVHAFRSRYLDGARVDAAVAGLER